MRVRGRDRKVFPNQEFSMANTRKLVLICGIVVLASVLTLVSSPGHCDGLAMGPYGSVGPSFGPPPGLPPMLQQPPYAGGPHCGPPMPMCMPKPCVLAAAEPSVYVGYLFKEDGLAYDLEMNNLPLGGFSSFTNRFDLQGVLLEVSAPVTLSTGMGAMLALGHVFTFEETGREWYLGFPGKDWTTDTQWWYVQGAGTYAFHPAVSLVGGFRWDSFLNNFKNGELISPGLAALASPEDRADVTFSGYIPFAGLVFHSPPNCSGHSVMLGAIGFPIIWASWDHKESLSGPGAVPQGRFSGSGEITSGHFLEAFGEYSIQTGNLNVGAFGRFSSLYGVDASSTLELLGVGVGPEDFSFRFDRRHWVFGAKASVSFTTPL